LGREFQHSKIRFFKNAVSLSDILKFFHTSRALQKDDAMNVIQTVRSVILFFVSISSHVYAAWDISLKITQQASNGIGSEVFAIQPIIEIFDKAGINKHVNIEGRVVASLSHADYKDEKLGIAGLDECDVETYRQEISVDVVEGDVNFSGLCINRSGDDYKITYTLFDEFDIILGDVIQSNLSVEVGEPFAMGIVQHPIDCQGGVMWSVNPIVAIQDRGRNTVKNVNDGNVSRDRSCNTIGIVATLNQLSLSTYVFL
jgi:hypothetical protein